MDSARVEAARERKSLSRYISDKLKNEVPAKTRSIDLDEVCGVFHSGKPNFKVPSRHVLYGREGR